MGDLNSRVGAARRLSAVPTPALVWFRGSTPKSYEPSLPQGRRPLMCNDTVIPIEGVVLWRSLSSRQIHPLRQLISPLMFVFVGVFAFIVFFVFWRFVFVWLVGRKNCLFTTNQEFETAAPSSAKQGQHASGVGSKNGMLAAVQSCRYRCMYTAREN